MLGYTRDPICLASATQNSLSAFDRVADSDKKNSSQSDLTRNPQHDGPVLDIPEVVTDTASCFRGMLRNRCSQSS